MGNELVRGSLNALKNLSFKYLEFYRIIVHLQPVISNEQILNSLK